MEILYQIFGFIFRIFFDFVKHYGLALLIFTVFTRLILLPSTIKQQKASAKTMRLQPKLRRIREKYQDYNPQERQQKIQQETSALYQREGTSPMGGGCLPLLIQMPILFGLYGVIRNPMKYILQISDGTIETLKKAATTLGYITKKNEAYGESIILSRFDEILKNGGDAVSGIGKDILTKIEEFDFTILGVDLGLIPKDVFEAKDFSMAGIIVIAVPVLAALSSLLTSLLTQMRQKKANPNMENQQMMGCMMFTMPLFSGWLAWSFPVGMGMYWILSSVIAFVQTLILGNIYAPRKTIARDMVEETIYRRSYEKNKKAIAAKGEDAE